MEGPCPKREKFFPKTGKGIKNLSGDGEEEEEKKGKIRKTRLNSNGRPVSKIGKFKVQNW